jgi:hypothetical protein
LCIQKLWKRNNYWAYKKRFRDVDCLEIPEPYREKRDKVHHKTLDCIMGGGEWSISQFFTVVFFCKCFGLCTLPSRDLFPFFTNVQCHIIKNLTDLNRSGSAGKYPTSVLLYWPSDSEVCIISIYLGML